MQSTSIPGFPLGTCEQEERRVPEPATAVRAARLTGPGPGVELASNRVSVALGRIFWNEQNVRVAMTPHRIRIGCSEVSIEAARQIMAMHAMRFGPPENEVWNEIQ